MKKGFGLLGFLVIAAIIALFVSGGLYLKRLKKDSDTLKQANDAIEQAEQAKSQVETSTDQGSQVGVVVTKKKVRLIAPNGGEVWKRKNQYNVRWTTTLAGSVKMTAVLFRPKQLVADPYATAPGAIAGVEMFRPATFPSKENEGSYTYVVPETLPAGKYQVVLWAGDNCSPTNKQKRCDYDLSDGFFTIQ